MLTLLRCTLGLLLAAGSAGAARAQARDTGARLERVADSVYVILHDDATDQWPHGNTGVIVTPDGVLVVDATYLPSRARADIALIRTVTDRPVRYLVYTHWHFDHNNGAIAYRDSFPAVTIVSERQTRDYIALNSTWWARMSTAPASARRASLAALQQEFTAGRDSTGRGLTAEEKRKDAKAIEQRQNELAELASLRVVTPDLVFDEELTLWLGGRRIELRDRGRANSPHDVTIYLPKDSVLFTGDIVVQSPLPYVGASWPSALDRGDPAARSDADGGRGARARARDAGLGLCAAGAPDARGRHVAHGCDGAPGTNARPDPGQPQARRRSAGNARVDRRRARRRLEGERAGADRARVEGGAGAGVAR